MILRKITPTDVLFLRGNRLFGGAGEHGEAQMPPWPSVFSGAVASRALADKGLIPKITKRPDQAEAILKEALGQDFACTLVGLSRRGKAYLPLPSDLVCMKGEDGLEVACLSPKRIPDGLKSSASLPMVPVLTSSARVKPETGIWMDMDGWMSHLAGKLPDTDCLVSQSELWGLDARLGIARDHETRTAQKGRIYTSEAVALTSDTSFIVGFNGKDIPDSGLLRLGGDGRGATITSVELETIERIGKPESNWRGFRMILVTPGIFPAGWLPPGCEEDEGSFLFQVGGLTARLEAAAIGRPQTVSGWDMARHEPKPAVKVVPSGSVYWFRVLKGDTSDLTGIWQKGLYSMTGNVDLDTFAARRREGYGWVWFGKWDIQD